MKLGLIFAIMLVLAVGLALQPLLAKGKKGRNTKTLVFLGVLIAVASGGIYYLVGTPVLVTTPEFLRGLDQPDVGESPAGQEAMFPSIDDMLDGLKAQVAENPGDIEGWIKLAKSLMSLGRYQEAIEVYRQAVNLAPDDAGLRSTFGEALTLRNEGLIPDEAAEAFETALALNPDDLISRFYLGDYAFQNGNVRLAYERWLALLEEVPEDTPWLPPLAQRIRDAASKLGLEPPALLTEKQYREPVPPSPEDIRQMSPEDQQAMIEEMVANLAARLEENPGDLAGWERLGRSYLVLGRYDEGIRAFALVAGARPDDPTAQENYVQAILTWLEQTGQHINDQALAGLQRLISLDPGNPTALFFLGQAAAERGDPASARLYWQRLLTLIDPASEGAKMVKQRLDALG